MILSILHTGHHPVFQHWCVRTSMGYYPHFILPMRRSRGFASTATNLIAHFRLAFASAPRQYRLTLLGTVSRRIIMQKAHRQASPAQDQGPQSSRPGDKETGRQGENVSLPVSLSPGLPVCSTWSLIPGWLDALRSLVGMWFQVHYPPLKGVLPIVRSRYWCA